MSHENSILILEEDQGDFRAIHRYQRIIEHRRGDRIPCTPSAVGEPARGILVEEFREGMRDLGRFRLGEHEFPVGQARAQHVLQVRDRLHSAQGTPPVSLSDIAVTLHEGIGRFDRITRCARRHGLENDGDSAFESLVISNVVAEFFLATHDFLAMFRQGAQAEGVMRHLASQITDTSNTGAWRFACAPQGLHASPLRPRRVKTRLTPP